MKTAYLLIALVLMATLPGKAQTTDTLLASLNFGSPKDYQYKIVQKNKHKKGQKAMRVKVYPKEVVLQYLTPVAVHSELRELKIPVKGKDKFKLSEATIEKLKAFRTKLDNYQTNAMVHAMMQPLDGEGFWASFDESTGPIDDYMAQLQKKDPFKAYFYPPELIMQYKNKIGLTEAQEDELRKTMDLATKQFNDLNWELKSATQGLMDIIAATKVDLAEAEAQLAKVLTLEEQVKTLQLRVMVTVKNQLTESQQQQLDSFKQ